MDRNLMLIVLAVIIVVLIIWYANRKRDAATAMPLTYDTTSQATEKKILAKANDKIIFIKNVSESGVRKVLQDFCNSYNDEYERVKLALVKLSEEEYVVSFPNDVEFDVYCFLVNYLNYPTEVRWNGVVLGWASVTIDSISQKAMFYIPAEDTEYDNVYFTTLDGIMYKHGFAIGKGKQKQSSIFKSYIPPVIELITLTEKKAEYFK